MNTGKKVLIVEDDAEFVEILRINLESAGFAVHEAADGKDGLRLLFEIKPDVVLLDLMMPVMSGEEFISVKRRYLTVEDIPIIVMSAREFPMPLDERGAVCATLMKPVSFDRIVEIVRDCCDRAPA